MQTILFINLLAMANRHSSMLVMILSDVLNVDSEPAIMATTILRNKISTNNTHAYINAFEAFKRMGLGYR